MHLAVDEHERQAHIVAGERLFGDRTFGMGEQGAQFAFEVSESARVRRFVLLHQGGDTLGEVFERSPGIAGSRFVDRRVGYFHWGSPPQSIRFASNILAEDHCPVFLSQPACRDKLSPVPLHSYIGIFHKSLEFDQLYVVLDVSSRSSPERAIACTIVDTLHGILDGAPWHGRRPYATTHFTRRLLPSDDIPQSRRTPVQDPGRSTIRFKRG